MLQSGTAKDAVRVLHEQKDGRTVPIDDFIGSHTSSARGPRAFRVNCWPGRVIKPHFHRIDQYQVFVTGEATVGKHEVSPVTVHYTDGFTPYGPITAGSADMAFFTLRARQEGSAYYMPGSGDIQERRAGRAVTVHTKRTLGEPIESIVEEQLIEPHDDGLAASERLAAPGETVAGDTAAGSGRFLLVIDGSLSVGDSAYSRESVVFIPPAERVPDRTAGSEGAHWLELQLPHA